MSKKGILILSTASDQTTNRIIRLLIARGIKFFRINYADPINISVIDLDNITLENSSISINLENDINSVWFRRGEIFKSNTFRENIIQRIYDREIKDIKSFLFDFLEQKFKTLGSFSVELSLNKLIVLSAAVKVGLSVPDSILLLNKTFTIERNYFFAKTINNIPSFLYNSYQYYPRYSIVPKGVYHNSVGFIQSYIEKEFEIRSFYLDGEFYSMAIFSQRNPKTKYDYRNYDDQKPNRLVPFQLPEKIKSKLIVLLKKLNLNTASIDLIYSKNREFVFLEINPSGQFEWLSYHCNYYIENKIVNFLYEK